MLGQQPQKGLMVVCTGRGMWTGKEEATTAPGGRDVSLTEIEYIEQVLRVTGSPKLRTSV